MKSAKICHGFYGASSMERLPVETALTDQVRRFKAIGRR
jgi:predicted TIM-barrel enzyme